MANAHDRWWFDYWAHRLGGDWPGEDDGDRDLPRLYRQQAGVLASLVDGHVLRRVLELGCGDGQLYDHMHLDGVEYWGVDFREAQIDAFRVRHPELRLFAADAASFRADERFDLIFSVSLLHYLDASMVRQHLANAHAMLADDGILLVTDFQWRSHHLPQLLMGTAALARARSLAGIRSGLREISLMRHMTAYSRREIATLGTRAGFATEFYGSLIVPGYLTARMTKTASPIRPSTK